MIRCPWCGAENYAIDMWCGRCQHHLDWQPAHRASRHRRTVGRLATAAATMGVALAAGLPAAAWFNGTLVPSPTRLPDSSTVQAAPVWQAPAASPSPTAGTPPALAVAVQPPAWNPPAVASAGDPVGAINEFYQAVSAHRFGDAAALWSQTMRSLYPPSVYIDQRFSATQQIGLTSDRVVADDGAAALVAVDIGEVIAGQRREWIGTWQLVRTSSGWLLNTADLRAG